MKTADQIDLNFKELGTSLKLWNCCAKHLQVFEKSKYERPFWNNWHEKHLKNQLLITKLERNNDINEQLKRTKYLNVITSTKSFKNCNKKLGFIDQHFIILNFCKKSLIFSIINNSNLARWNIRDSPNCNLPTNKPQKKIHFLDNCTSGVNDGRFKWGHNSIICGLP